MQLGWIRPGLWAFVGLVVWASWPGIVQALSGPSPLITPLLYHVDTAGRLNLPGAVALPAAQWQAMSPSGSLGYRADVVWFHAKWSLPAHATGERWVLEIANPVLDAADVWVQGLGPDGRPGTWQHWAVGDKRPVEQRPVTAQHVALPIDNRPVTAHDVGGLDR